LNLIKKIFLPTSAIVSVFLFSTNLQSQDLIYKSSNSGFNIGINLAVGTHFQRLGLNFNFFYINNFFQSNSELRAYFSFKNLGPKFIYKELVLSQGVLFGYGTTKHPFNSFISSISNQTGYLHSVAYTYNAYFNDVKTTQQTGIISLQFNQITFATENDILARPFYDRYRTGAFLLSYQYENLFQAGVNSTLWTGRMGRTITGDTNYKAICYMDTVRGTYTNHSHGLLSAQFKYNLGRSQTAQANVGIDAEQVRNAFQNKLIHDFCFIPANWFKRTNCHIPMLDNKGGQYLHKPDQKIKKPKPYLNVYTNAGVFY
jgi:hypothetical protein